MQRLLSSARIVRRPLRFVTVNHGVRGRSLCPCPAYNLDNFPTVVIRQSSSSSTSSSTTTATNPTIVSRLHRLVVSATSGLQPGSSDDDVSSSEPKLEFTRLLEVAKRERSLIGFALAAQLVSASSMLVFPLALGNIVDAVSGSLPADLNSLVALMGGVFVVSGAATSSRVIAMSLAGSRISRQLRVKLYEAIMRQDTAFFDFRKSGELVNRLSNDVPLVSRTLTENLAKILRSGVTATSSLALIMYLSPKLSLITLCSIPPIGLFATVFGRSARKLSRRLVDALAIATQVAAERMGAIRTVRTFGAEIMETRRYARHVDDTYTLAKQVAIADGAYAGSVQLAAQMSLLGVLWFGGRMVLNPADPMTIGALTSFSMYAVNLGVSVAGVGTAYGQLARALGAAYRIFEVVDRKPEGPSSTAGSEKTNFDDETCAGDGNFDIQRAHGYGISLQPGYDATVKFENVRFTYPARPESEVLKGIDLNIRPGEIVAVAGTSGSGKSTLSALLSKLYEPTGGDITLAGTPISELDAAWLRNEIAVVSQVPVLFSGSIAENISYGMRGEVPMAQIVRAAKAAASHDMIMALPDAYNTAVGERGESLSGGQRARIALCRALVRNPRVLVLDEHSAALDAESERAVAQAVLSAASEMKLAVITIAHRTSSLKRAHRVAFLVDGRVAEMDSYDRLMGNEHSRLKQLLAPTHPDIAGDEKEPQHMSRFPLQ